MNKLTKQTPKIEEVIFMAEIGRASLQLFHDVLNPISSLALYLDIISKKRGTNKKLKANIKPLVESSQKIREFIKMIQTDFKDSKKVAVELNEIIGRVIKILSHRAILYNVSVVFAQRKIGQIVAKKIKIYQIFINLLSNAIDSFQTIKDNRKRVVAVSTEKSRGHIIIHIKDNGCGIAENKLKKLFTKFYTTKKTGIGIGLFNTKEIIEKDFSGEISFESAIDKGTLCKIKIPI